MMNYKLIGINILLVLSLITISCKGKFSSNELFKDKIVQESFTTNEIKELAQILDFFESEICHLEEVNQDCYSSFFKTIRDTNYFQIGVQIDYTKQKELYNNLAICEDLFVLQKTYGRMLIDTILTQNLRTHSKYEDFLKLVAQKDLIVNYYYQSFVAARDLSPIMVGHLMMSSEKYNIKDVKVRLLIAIHYLVLNDREERYRNQKIYKDGY